MTADISPILDLVATYRNSARLLVASYHPIREWLANGCDIRQDIVPVMEKKMLRHSGIYSFNFFTNDILKARDERLRAEHLRAKGAVIDPEAELKRMKHYAWMRDFVAKGGQLVAYGRHKDELTAYEAKHGPVTP
jgi:hypothetical protein